MTKKNLDGLKTTMGRTKVRRIYATFQGFSTRIPI